MAGKKSFALCLLSIVANTIAFGADIIALGTSGHTKELKAGKLSVKNTVFLPLFSLFHSISLSPDLSQETMNSNQPTATKNSLHLGLITTMEHASVAMDISEDILQFHIEKDSTVSHCYCVDL